MVERVKLKKKVAAPPPAPEPKPLKTYGGATECKHCHHYYIQPCDDKRARSCPNMLALAKPKGKAK